MSTLSVETGLRIPASGNAHLGTDVVRPSGSGPFPTVLMRTAYDRTTAASRALQVDALSLANDGFAVVLQDVRGRFGSTGRFEPFVHEQEDGLATIEWISNQAWSDGRVALAGISYNSYCQLAAAAGGPGAVAALVPGLGPFDVRTSWLRPSGVDALGFHAAWLAGSLLPADPRTTNADDVLAAWDVPGHRDLLDPSSELLACTPGQRWLAEWTTEHPYESDSRVPTAHELAEIRAPAMVVGGLFDVFATGSIDLASAIGDESGLVLGPWDHAGLPLSRRAGDADHGQSAALSLSVIQRSWYDLCLRGAGEVPARARVFVTGSNLWSEFGAWPPPGRRSTYWFSADGRLVDVPEDADCGFVVDGDDPTPTRGGRVYPWEPALRSGSFDQASVRSRPDVVTFETPPLASAVTAMGRADARLEVDADPGALVCLTLVDVHPDGSAWNIADGVATVAQSGATDVDLGYVSHWFGPGHGIGVQVAGASWPRYAVVPGRRTLALAGCSINLLEVSL